MPDFSNPPVVMVTWKNLYWAAEKTGYSKEELEAFLREADKNDVVCTVQAKR